MNMRIANSSTSSIAIETATSQAPAVVIPFPQRRATETANDNTVSYDPVNAAPSIDDLEESYADEPVNEISMAVDIVDEIVPEPFTIAPAHALIERGLLTRAVEIAGNVVDRRSTIPILSNVMLRADEDEIVVTGTDLDIQIQTRVAAAVDGHFGTTLPAHLLKELLKKATASDYVAINTDDGKDSLDFERAQYALNSLPVNDYPDMKAPGADAVCFTLPGDTFWKAIDSTMGAISTEETRYYLNGIFLHAAHDETLRFVATDGHRLYMQSLPLPEITGSFPGNGYGHFAYGVIMPRKLVETLHKLMKGKACPPSVEIRLDAAKSRFVFMLGDCLVTVTGKHVDGTFPDYQRVIPAHNERVASFNAADMKEALRAVSLIASERGRAVRYTFQDGKCELVVSNPDQGTAKSSISCEFGSISEDAPSLDIGFNSAYMAEILDEAVADGERVQFKLADPGAPAVVTGDRKGWTGVLMPMRV